MPGFFDDEIGLLDDLHKFSGDVNELNFDEAVNNNTRLIAMSMMKKTLIQAAKDAMVGQADFDNYPLLGEHLLANLENEAHYWVTPDATDGQIFSEEIAGTFNDLIEGQIAAWGPHTAQHSHQERLFVWTYGIYKPAMEGGQVLPKKDRKTGFADLPSYEEIMDIRFGVWGDKAPYWILLEDGTTGGEAYPTIKGTGFVQKTRAKLRRILTTSREYAEAELREGMEDATADIIELGKYKPIVFGRISYGRTSVGELIQVEARKKISGIYYQLIIGGRYAEAILPGELLPTGGVFSP